MINEQIIKDVAKDMMGWGLKSRSPITEARCEAAVVEAIKGDDATKGMPLNPIHRKIMARIAAQTNVLKM